MVELWRAALELAAPLEVLKKLALLLESFLASQRHRMPHTPPTDFSMITGYADLRKQTVLHDAAWFKQWECLQWLVEGGCDLYAEGKAREGVCNSNVIALAVWQRAPEHIVQFLLDNKADIAAEAPIRDEQWRSAGAKPETARGGRPSAEHADPPMNTVNAVHAAFSTGQWQVGWVLLRDYDDKGLAWDWTRHGASYLHKAVELGAPEDTLRRLLSLCGHVDQQDEEGRSLLYRAMQLGKWRLAQWLLDHKADPNLRASNGLACLAFGGGAPDSLLTSLRAHGARVNLHDKQACQLALNACAERPPLPWLVCSLVRAQADPTLKMEDDAMSPLQRAAKHQRWDMFQLLLQGVIKPPVQEKQLMAFWTCKNCR